MSGSLYDLLGLVVTCVSGSLHDLLGLVGACMSGSLHNLLGLVVTHVSGSLNNWAWSLGRCLCFWQSDSLSLVDTHVPRYLT